MACDATATFVYGLLSGQSFRLDTHPLFWAAFAYPTVAGTIVAFLCCLTILKREGSARTMYISVLVPVGAVLVSVIWEDFQFRVLTCVGIFTALLFAWITQSEKKSQAGFINTSFDLWISLVSRPAFAVKSRLTATQRRIFSVTNFRPVPVFSFDFRRLSASQCLRIRHRLRHCPCLRLCRLSALHFGRTVSLILNGSCHRNSLRPGFVY